MPTAKSSKMLSLINYRLRVTIHDSRMLVGTFMAFDRHMNMVLGDCEEFRHVKTKKAGKVEERQERRPLGLVLLRGENIVSLQVEAPPANPERKQVAPAGPGMGRAAARGLPSAAMGAAPAGLSGPVPGLGGPAASAMRPNIAAQAGAQSYGRGPPGMMPPRPGMMPPGMMPPRPGMMPPRPGMMPPGMMPRGMPPRGPPQ